MGVILTRSLILYVLVIFAVRLMGKRQLGELQPSELVITILVSNIATLPALSWSLGRSFVAEPEISAHKENYFGISENSDKGRKNRPRHHARPEIFR